MTSLSRLKGVEPTWILLFSVVLLLSGSEQAACDSSSDTWSLFENDAAMQRLAVRFDCYFTIEDVFQSQTPNVGRAYRAQLPGLASKATFEDLMATLRAQLHGFVITTSGDKRIVHIINKQLADRPTHLLNSEFDSEFRGTPTGFLEATSRHGFGAMFPLTGTFGVKQFDLKTNIVVPAGKRPMRRSVTDCLPLSKYNRLLWVAESNKYNSSTVLYFKGISHPFFYRPEIMEGKLVDWSLGETAYEVNLHIKGSAEHAARYVEEHLKAGESHQVRWAMWHLGRMEDEKSIPLLIRHIDYQFAKTFVVEENYPAVRALVMMGKPATVPIVNAFQETLSPLRLQLLALSLSGIEGRTAAEAILDRNANLIDDRTVRERFQRAAAHLKGFKGQ